MDTVQINVKKEIFVSLVDMHALMKKIELMESNTDTPNIENLLGKESTNYTSESLPKNTHQVKVLVCVFIM